MTSYFNSDILKSTNIIFVRIVFCKAARALQIKEGPIASNVLQLCLQGIKKNFLRKGRGEL